MRTSRASAGMSSAASSPVSRAKAAVQVSGGVSAAGPSWRRVACSGAPRSRGGSPRAARPPPGRAGDTPGRAAVGARHRRGAPRARAPGRGRRLPASPGGVRFADLPGPGPDLNQRASVPRAGVPPSPGRGPGGPATASGAGSGRRATRPARAAPPAAPTRPRRGPARLRPVDEEHHHLVDGAGPARVTSWTCAPPRKTVRSSRSYGPGSRNATPPFQVWS